MVSALKVDGRRLHELAREGLEIERAAAPGARRPLRHRRRVVRRRRPPGAAASRSTAGRHLRPLAGRRSRSRCSAPVPICATCGAPPSSRSRSTRPRRPRRCVLLPPIEAVRALSKVTVDDDDAGRRSPSASRCRRRRRRAVGDGHRRRRAARRLRAVRRTALAKPAVVLGDGPVASTGVQVITDRRSGTVARRTHGRHDRRLRRRPPRPSRRDRPGAGDRRRVGRPLGGAHVRPPPGDGRAAGVGAAAAHRSASNASSCSPRRASTPPSCCRSTRSSPTSRRSRSSSACSCAALARPHRRRRRGLPLRRPSARPRRPAREARPHQRLRGAPGRADRATRRRERAAQLDGDPAGARRRRRHPGGEHARAPPRGARRGDDGRPARPPARVPDRQRQGAPRSCACRPTACTPGGSSGPTAAEHPCAINLGRRPTFYEHAEASLLEAHLLDFDGDLYGEHVKVRFAHFLRSERKFDGIEAIVAQLKLDVAHARALLSAG